MKKIPLLMALILALGCSSESPDGTSPTAPPSGAPEPTEAATTPTQPIGSGTQAPDGQADLTPVGEGSGVDQGDIELPPAATQARRLRISQLAASIPVIAGDDIDGNPITWTINSRGRTFDALDPDVLGSTLGMADYVTVTEEQTEPSMLYLKFMDDMARDVCRQMAVADYSHADASSRVLVRLAALDQHTGPEIDANLRYLSLRFLGVKIADDDTQSIADVRALFDAVVSQSAAGTAQAKAQEAWGTLCVGLFLNPAFHIY